MITVASWVLLVPLTAPKRHVGLCQKKRKTSMDPEVVFQDSNGVARFREKIEAGGRFARVVSLAELMSRAHPTRRPTASSITVAKVWLVHTGRVAEEKRPPLSTFTKGAPAQKVKKLPFATSIYFTDGTASGVMFFDTTHQFQFLFKANMNVPDAPAITIGSHFYMINPRFERNWQLSIGGQAEINVNVFSSGQGWPFVPGASRVPLMFEETPESAYVCFQRVPTSTDVWFQGLSLRLAKVCRGIECARWSSNHRNDECPGAFADLAQTPFSASFEFVFSGKYF